MKKIYATMTAVALSAMTAMAGNHVGFAASNFNPYAPERAPKEIKERLARQNLDAQQAKLRKAVKGNRVVSMDVIGGKFVSSYEEMYPVTGYETKLTTCPVDIVMNGDEVELGGLAGWYEGAYNASVTFTANIKGTYANGEIHVPSGQVIGAYDGRDIVFYTVDEEGYEIEEGGNFVWNPEDGVFEADFCTWMDDGQYYWGSPGYYPALYPANGVLTYETDNQNFLQVEQPVYYTIYDDDADGVDDTFMVTSLTPFGEGYITFWPIDETGLAEISSSTGERDDNNRPIPTFEGVAYASESSAGVKAFSLCCYDGNYYGTFLMADVVDPNLITIPAPGYTFQGETNPINGWFIMTLAAGNYFGDFEQATITYVDPQIDGIENIQLDNSNAPVEYYNLQGVRVVNPVGGLYIVKQGDKSAKVLVK